MTMTEGGPSTVLSVAMGVLFRLPKQRILESLRDAAARFIAWICFSLLGSGGGRMGTMVYFHNILLRCYRKRFESLIVTAEFMKCKGSRLFSTPRSNYRNVSLFVLILCSQLIRNSFYYYIYFAPLESLFLAVAHSNFHSVIILMGLKLKMGLLVLY